MVYKAFIIHKILTVHTIFIIRRFLTWIIIQLMNV